MSVCLKYSFGHTKKISTTNIVFLTCPLGLLKKIYFGQVAIWSEVLLLVLHILTYSTQWSKCDKSSKPQRLKSMSFVFFVTNQSGESRVLGAKIFQFLAHCSPLAFYSIENLFVWKKCASFISYILQEFFFYRI